MAQIKHWADSARNQKKFSAEAERLELGSKDVLLALSPDGETPLVKVSDFSGTFHEAMTALQRHASRQQAASEAGRSPDERTGDFERLTGSGNGDAPVDEPEQEEISPDLLPRLKLPDAEQEQKPASPEPEPEQPDDNDVELFERCRELPELPVIAFTYFIDQRGFKWSFTVRAGLPFAELRQAMNQVLRVIDLFDKAADSNDWLPANSNGRTVSAAPAKQTQGQDTDSDEAPPDGGVERIDYVCVTAPKGKPQVEFWRDGRQWPELKWNLGGDALVDRWPEFLSEAGLSGADLDEVGINRRIALVAKWVPSPKNPKWKDIVSIEFV